MKTLRITNRTRRRVLCEHCAVADVWWKQLRGLLGRSSLRAGEGLLIVPCAAVHTVGMKFPLDVVFLTADDIVSDLAPNLAPGKIRIARSPRTNTSTAPTAARTAAARTSAARTRAALELPAGAIARSGTRIGDRLLREVLEEEALEEEALEAPGQTDAAPVDHQKVSRRRSALRWRFLRDRLLIQCRRSSVGCRLMVLRF